MEEMPNIQQLGSRNGDKCGPVLSFVRREPHRLGE